MPNAPKTQHRSVRIDDDDWRDLKTRAPGGDRSAAIKELLAWYLRRPGAKLPKRPDPPAVDAPPVEG
ncbi:hypothetical protein FCH28_09645 [Streptomyces piniterrae]|uniref:Uncharacterized protein n=1 Tax=Streptomyces piniterrae TaxID=2571125 RepID=A0A4U0NZ02_9ACTN|nr:hypothetical protein [Streptomyces piniterrae]TJZ55594.1 hypothetical protein FCH28_09645 [Streptomyces piniterrae]